MAGPSERTRCRKGGLDKSAPAIDEQEHSAEDVGRSGLTGLADSDTCGDPILSCLLKKGDRHHEANVFAKFCCPWLGANPVFQQALWRCVRDDVGSDDRVPL